jgi:NAD(P)-dependent dehydrogenase (short-subunit alcohol dehydrogenase family)
MAKQPRSLSGKVAVVTGGGRGIGRATCEALVREGVRVTIGDVDGESAERTAAELGHGAEGLFLDVTDLPGYTAFLDEVERRRGPVDILINNAGIMPITPLEEESPASITRQLEINLRAVIHGTQEAIRRMRPRGTGHIVNIASLAGKAGYPGLATYAATKHAVVGLSEAVRFELRGSGVEVSCVMPGIVTTELTAGMTEARGVKNLTPEQVAGEIVSALKVPRFDVYVPRSTGPLLMVAGILPRRAREAMARLMKADQVAVSVDHSRRAAYEDRAAHSAPAAERVVEAEQRTAA